MIQLQAFRIVATLEECIRSDAGECKTNLPSIGAGNGQVRIVTQLAFMVIGVIALVVIMLAGYKLMISSGDPQGFGKARQTLIYAVVGLIVAVSAELIITLVINRL